MSCVYSENVIVEYQQKVKLLEEENKKLKEDLEKAWDQRGDKWRKARIKKLTEENKKLQETVDYCEGIMEGDEDLKERHQEDMSDLKEEIKKLKGEQLTEENAIRYVYENTSEYDDWVKGSEVYKELEEKNKKLQFDYDIRADIGKGLVETIEILKEEKKKQKKEHIQNIMKTKRIATELYREMKYALGYGEFDEPDRKVMYEEIKKLKEESKVDKEFQEEVMQENKKLKEREYEMCQIANANGWDIYPTDSEEEEDSDDPDEE
jgi:hypothetical protein